MEEPPKLPDDSPEAVAPPPFPTAPPWTTLIATYAIIVVCTAISAYLNFAKGSPGFEEAAVALMPSGFAVWTGSYWGLLSTAFVHLGFWHLLFNMWWAKDFGTLLEPTLGRPKFLLFVAASALVSSGAQLAWSEETGIGFSGVVYAMFGYLLAARHVEPRYQTIINKQTIQWLLGWMVLCVVLTYTGAMHVANAAHIAGFLFGYCAGNAFAARKWILPSHAGLALLVAVTILSATYMPWSEKWEQRDLVAKFLTAAEQAEKDDPEAQLMQALLLMRNSEDKGEAFDWLRKSAAQGYIPAMNTLAWHLATDREDKRRSGPEAVEWAKKTCEKDGSKTAAYLDTLAAAYAEVEKWEEAITTQKLAISKVTDKSSGKADLAGYEARLQLLLKHEKIRE